MRIFETMSWIKQTKDGSITVNIHVQPKSSRNRIAGLHGDALKLNITAAPVDGQANQAVVAFLAKSLKIPKSAIVIIAGSQSRQKRLKIDQPGLASEAVEKILLPAPQAK